MDPSGRQVIPAWLVQKSQTSVTKFCPCDKKSQNSALPYTGTLCVVCRFKEHNLHRVYYGKC